LLDEQNDEWEVRRRYMSLEALAQVQTSWTAVDRVKEKGVLLEQLVAQVSTPRIRRPRYTTLTDVTQINGTHSVHHDRA